MKPFCQYCFNDPMTHNQQKEICGTCEMETKVAKRKITNADRIRSMTDEQLATLLETYCYCGRLKDYCPAALSTVGIERCISNRSCYYGLLSWLKQEVDGHEP